MDNSTDLDKQPSLLTDEDFLKLMEAEYSQSAEGIDELEKASILRAIRKKLRPERRHYGWQAWVLAAAGLCLGLWPFLAHYEADSLLRTKGQALKPNVSLEVMVYVPDQVPIAAEHPKFGSTLIFKASSPTLTWLALTLQINDQRPELRFRMPKAESGPNILLAGAESAYAYTLDTHQQHLKFCLLAAAELKELDQWIKNLPREWPQTGAMSCQEFDIP